MAQATGAGAALLVGIQSNISTVATEGFQMPFNSSGVKSSRNQNTANTLTGRLDPVEPFEGNRSVAGPLVIPFDSASMYYWLQFMFGNPTTTGSDPYTHVFDTTGARPYFTLEHGFTDLGTAQYFAYLGCKVSQFSMSIGGDQELVGNLTVTGSNRTIGAASFDATPETPSFARLKNFQASIKEGGSAISNVTSVDFSLNWNVDSSQYVIGGGGVLGAIPDGVMTISGTINALFEDMVMLNKAINGTESSLEVTLTDSADSTAIIKFPELKYAEDFPIINGPTGIGVSLPFSAYYNNDAAGSAAVMTLINEDSHA